MGCAVIEPPAEFLGVRQCQPEEEIDRTLVFLSGEM